VAGRPQTCHGWRSFTYRRGRSCPLRDRLCCHRWPKRPNDGAETRSEFRPMCRLCLQVVLVGTTARPEGRSLGAGRPGRDGFQSARTRRGADAWAGGWAAKAGQLRFACRAVARVLLAASRDEAGDSEGRSQVGGPLNGQASALAGGVGVFGFIAPPPTGTASMIMAAFHTMWLPWRPVCPTCPASSGDITGSGCLRASGGLMGLGGCDLFRHATACRLLRATDKWWRQTERFQ
jgi:hypothetical protein